MGDAIKDNPDSRMKLCEQFLEALDCPAMLINRELEVVARNSRVVQMVDKKVTHACDFGKQLFAQDSVECGFNVGQCLIPKVFETGKIVRSRMSSPVCKKDGQQENREIECTFSLMQGSDKQSLVLYCYRDVTDLMRMSDSLRQSEERFAAASAYASGGIWDYDLKADKIYYSPRFAEIAGQPWSVLGDNLTGWLDLVHPEDADDLQSDMIMHLEGKSERFESEHRLKNTHGDYHWVMCRGSAMRDQEGFAYRLVGSITDINDKKLLEEELRFRAYHDTLTGLLNRTAFLEKISEAIGRAQQGDGYQFSLLLLDIDDFKRANDALGPEQADEYLKAVGDWLKSEIKSDEIKQLSGERNVVSRLNGDEFAVLLDGSGAESGRTIATILQQKLMQDDPLLAFGITTSMSIGIASSHGEINDPLELLSHADTAQERAKHNGKACQVVFDEAMQKEVQDAVQTEADLRAALGKNQFELYYQPVVNLSDGQLVGFESLLRWNHPTRGLVPPDKFIPVAEKTRLILPIGEWVLGESCRRLADWQNRIPGCEQLFVSVNLSKRQFRAPDLVDALRIIIAHAGIDPRTLKLEITESTMMENPAAIMYGLNELRALGVQLMMDDFGTGHSSLAKLHEFPIDWLKIDKSFVREMESTRDFSAIIQAIINLAQNFNLQVVAEGIESKNQLAQLMALDCGYGQGYYFSKPVPAHEAERLLTHGWVQSAVA